MSLEFPETPFLARPSPPTRGRVEDGYAAKTLIGLGRSKRAAEVLPHPDGPDHGNSRRSRQWLIEEYHTPGSDKARPPPGSVDEKLANAGRARVSPRRRAAPSCSSLKN